MGKRYRVTANSLNVRREAKLSADIRGTLPKGTIVEPQGTQYEAASRLTWYRIPPNGWWVSGYYLEEVGETSTNTTPKTSSTPATNTSTAATVSKDTTTAASKNVTIDDHLNSQVMKTTAGVGNMTTNEALKTLSGARLPVFRMLHGAPFQFNSITDRRLVRTSGTDGYGWMYFKEVLSNMPIVSFIPGSPSFLAGWSTEKKNKVLAGLATDALDVMEKLSGGEVRNMQYYSHKSDFTNYYNLVNTCLRATASLMNIGGRNVPGIGKLESYDWRNFNKNVDTSFGESSNMKKASLGTDEAIHFAYDPASSIQNSLDNDTTESALASATKGISAKAREAQFLLGAGAGIEFEFSSDEYIEQIIPKMSDVTKYDPRNPISRIMRSGGTMLTGANMLFPEIWNDSRYSKAYTVDMKFESPYADPISKFMHVMVPFYHLLCLAGPRTIDANAYHSPFLIRAYSKGYFDVQLGMIDSISIKKFGDGDEMGDDMVPMSIEVSVSFKDLYQALHLASFEHPTLFFNNTGFMDLLGTMAGVSMNREGLAEKFSLFFKHSVIGQLRDLPGKLPDIAIDLIGIRDAARSIFGNNLIK